MRDIIWTDEAIGHLEAIVAYVAAFNPAAAERLGARLIEFGSTSSEYRVERERVVILRIRHGARAEE